MSSLYLQKTILNRDGLSAYILLSIILQDMFYILNEAINVLILQ